MNREQIIERLTNLPTAIELAETQLIAAEQRLRVTTAVLEDAKTQFMLGKIRIIDGGQSAWVTASEPPINGKNAEQREAQIRDLTAPWRADVESAQAEATRRRLDHNRAINEFRAMRSIAALLAGEAVSA